MHNILADLIASEFIPEDSTQQKIAAARPPVKCSDTVADINMEDGGNVRG